MSQKLITQEQVLKALNIESFRNLSKDKIMEFVSLIPNMDKDVAISIINQFLAYAELASNMVAQLNTMCDAALKENSISQKEVIESYKLILDSLSEVLKKDNISPEERAAITDKMILVADKISAKDTENKEFINNILKYGTSIIGGVLILGATILGVNAKGTKIPTLKSK